jgi:hypothetical protein
MAGIDFPLVPSEMPPDISCPKGQVIAGGKLCKLNKAELREPYQHCCIKYVKDCKPCHSSTQCKSSLNPKLKGYCGLEGVCESTQSDCAFKEDNKKKSRGGWGWADDWNNGCNGFVSGSAFQDPFINALEWLNGDRWQWKVTRGF